MLLDLAVQAAARAMAAWLDGAGDPRRAVSPAALEQMAAERRPLAAELLAALPDATLASARALFAQIAPRFGRDQYLWILQEDVLGRDHAAHVQVVLRHLDWYGAQMDQIVRALSGGRGAEPN